MNDIMTPREHTRLRLDRELRGNSVVHKNVDQEFIITTADKVQLCLIEHQCTLEARTDWKTPTGIFATILIALSTSTFKATLGVTAEAWQSIFVIGSIASGIWLATTIARAVRLRGRGGIDSIIRQLKQSSRSQD